MNWEFIRYYILIGVCWTLMWDYIGVKEGEPLTNTQRIMYIILWPINMLGFLAGMINSIIDKFTNNKND